MARSSGDGGTASIEEIVVTARNIEESLQEVPVAVTAIGRETLDQFRIDEATDLMSRVPALDISIGGSGQSAQINLRGVGSSSISNAFDSAIALNYDGISVSTQRLLQAAFFDVEQVSVLKGPQSLYFGKSASAGVLALQSANPTDTWQVGAKSSYELEEEGTTFGGFISGPITDTLGFRLAAEYQDIDKYLEVADFVPTSNPDRGLTNFISRVTFDWRPSEKVNANLKLNYNRQRSDTLNGLIDMFCGGDGLPDPSVIIGGAFGATPGIDLFLPSHNCDLGDGQFLGIDGDALINSVPTGSPGDNGNIGQAFNDTDTFFGRLRLDVALNDSFDVTVLTGYVDMENEYNDMFNGTGQNPDGTPAGLAAPFENTLKQWTNEVRLSSNFNGRFNFQLGGFWETRDMGLVTSQNAFNPSLFPPGFLGLPFGPDPVTGFTFDWLADRPIDAEALSFFVSGEVQLSERWELSGGVRWTDEEKSTSSFFPYVHTWVTSVFGAVGSGFDSGDIDFQDDNINPELVLRYIASDNMSFYGAYKSGFKSGGIDNNTLPTSGTLFADLLSSDPAVRGAAVDTLTFDSETSQGFELGMRSQLLDQTLMLNLTAYHFVYDDQQVQIFNPSVFAFDTFNAGEVTTYGVDIDWAWVTPIPGLRLFGAWGLLDAEITEGFETLGGENLEGRESGSAPAYSGNIALMWETQVGNNMRLSVSPNLYFSDSTIAGGATRNTFDPVTNPLGDIKQEAFTTIDLNVSLTSMDDKWRVSLISTNLTDEQIITGCGPAPFRPDDENPPPGVLPGDDQQCNFRRGQQLFLEAAYNF